MAMRAGRYAGVTSQGEPVSFDVTEDGDVTNVIAALAGTVVSISERFPVDDSGRWEGVAFGRGVSTRMRGTLGGGEATGSVEVARPGGAPVQSAEWQAKRIPGLAY